MEKPAPPSRLARFTDALGLRRSMVALLVMVVLVGLGERLGERFLPIYLLALGAGIHLPGVLNAMDNLLSALYSFPGGYLADRLGTKRALLVFNGIALLGYAIVVIFPTWWAVFVGSMFFLSWSAISLPASMSLVADALPRDRRTMGVSMHSLMRRLPMALGPIIGGILIDRFGTIPGIRLAFALAMALGLLSIVFQQMLIEDDIGLRSKSAEIDPRRVLRDMSPSLRVLLVADILVRFAEQIPYAYVVIWCIHNVGISGVEFGVLTTVEMVTAALIYLPVAYLADRSTKKPFVVTTFAFFTLFPLVLLFSDSFVLLVVAFVIRGLKEFGEPTRKALIMDLAPEGQKAGMFGAYYLARDVAVSVVALGSGFLWQISPAANLLTAAACGLAGTLLFAWRGRSLTA
ncbi:MAG: MFS transporter [Acidobacteriota bacterium]|nr:MFS transporter [Acidobacteriota bacterium]